MRLLVLSVLLLAIVTTVYGQQVKLGSSARIAISSSDIPTSYEFYKEFGFAPLGDASEDITSDTKLLRLTDGQIILTLLRETFKSPIIAYFADDLTMIEKLVKKTVTDAEVKRDDKGISEIIFKSPGGVTIDIHRSEANTSLKPSGAENPKCGTFSELSIGVPNRDSAVTFWKQLGFDASGVYNVPYPWGIVKDGNIVLGLYQSEDVKGAMLTYYSSKAEAQIQALVKAGIPIIHETPDPSGKKLNASFRSPDGVYFKVFYYAGKL